jgi:hypothetical protein
MPILIDIPEPREWSAADWKLLPNLRRPQHTDGDSGWEFHPLLWRCPHGVYVTEDPSPFWSGTGGPDGEILDNWAAPFCEVCYASYASEWREVWRRVPARRGRYFFKGRKLEAGEYRYQGEKLFDGRNVYPETFTKIIRLRDRSLTADLRLQEDPETDKPRLETMGGYVAKAFGYGHAGKGHGPDSDADNIRLSWMAQHADGPVGHAEPDPESTPWSATLPHLREIIGTHTGAPHPVPARDVRFRDFRLITAENWFPAVLPFGIFRPEPFRNYQGFLSERDYFADERTRAVVRVCVYKKDRSSLVGASLEVLKQIDKRRFEEAANHLRWYVLTKSARRESRWWIAFQPLPPTARELAQWRRNTWNLRRAPSNRVPRRRMPRWEENWRNERPMRDLAAKLKMHRYGDGLLQVSKMCETAHENYRKARLALAANHGKVGFWRSEKLEGGYRLSIKTGRWRWKVGETV